MESINLVEMGIPAGEGVLAAFIPANGDILREFPYSSGKREFVCFHQDGRALDLFPVFDEQNVKWWMVKQAAFDLGLDLIPTVWHGPAEEFNVESIPRTAQSPGTVLAVRQYTRGPWLTLEKIAEGTSDSENSVDSDGEKEDNTLNEQ